MPNKRSTRKELLDRPQNGSVVQTCETSLNPREKTWVQILYKNNFDKKLAYQEIHKDKPSCSKLNPNEWWALLFRSKEKAVNDYIDNIIASEYKDIHLTREEVVLQIFDIAKRAKVKGDLKMELDTYKVIAKILGYFNDNTVYNIANFLPAVEIHHKELPKTGSEFNITINEKPKNNETDGNNNSK